MTLLSCLGIGIAFLIAVGLLVFAAAIIGFSIPVRRPGRGRGDGEEP